MPVSQSLSILIILYDSVLNIKPATSHSLPTFLLKKDKNAPVKEGFFFSSFLPLPGHSIFLSIQ